MRYLFLRVSDKNEIALGAVSEAGDVAELLRYAADYYDDNPDSAEQLLDAPAEAPASALRMRFTDGSRLS